MPVQPVAIQRRLMEVGRVRLGEKGAKGEPKKLDAFRFTSASRALLERVADRYGGKVTEWVGAPNEGYFEVKTKAREIEIILPPSFSDGDGSGARYSQWYEHWSNGGCQRRCDGVTEVLSGKPCLCAAAGDTGNDRLCKITTRVSFLLPGSAVGVWRLETHGYYAAVEAPAMLDFLRDAGATDFIPALLRIENRVVKRDGKTHRFVVPVIDFPQVTVPELAEGGEFNISINAPKVSPPKPALPSGPETPEDPSFENEPEFGEQPALPVLESGVTSLPPVVETAQPVSAPEPEAETREDDASGSAPFDPVVQAAGEEPIPHQSRKWGGKTVAEVYAAGDDGVAWLHWYAENGLTERLKAAVITYLEAVE